MSNPHRKIIRRTSMVLHSHASAVKKEVLTPYTAALAFALRSSAQICESAETNTIVSAKALILEWYRSAGCEVDRTGAAGGVTAALSVLNEIALNEGVDIGDIQNTVEHHR